jgi:class 3 adenylate cyclase
MAGKMRPLQVMAMLNELYTELDKLVEKHKVYKVEVISLSSVLAYLKYDVHVTVTYICLLYSQTIGDAFMVVGGAPDRVPAPVAAERVALFALDAGK